MTHADMERRVGEHIGQKVVMMLLPDGTYYRDENGDWERYPDPPEVPIPKSA